MAPTQFFQKPSPSAQLDLRHPLARGLVEAAIHPGFLHLAREAHTPAGTVHPGCLGGLGTTSYNEAWDTQRMSIAVEVDLPADPGSAFINFAVVGFFISGADESNVGIAWTTGSEIVVYDRHNSTAFDSLEGSLSYPYRAIWSMSRNGSTNARYKNGLLNSTGSHYGSAFAVDTRKVLNSTGTNDNFRVRWFMLWDRELSANEHALLARDPFAMFRPERRAWEAAAGGTEYTQSLAGALTGVGAVALSTSRDLGGTLASSGSAVRRLARAISGTLASDGTLTTLRTSFVSVSGTWLAAGSVLKRIARSVAGTIATSGHLARHARITLDGTLSTVGTVAALKTAVLAVAGALSSAGDVSRRFGRQLTGALTSTGAVSLQGARALAGTLASSGSVAAVKAAILAVGGALGVAGLLVHQVSRALVGTLASTGSVARASLRSIAGTLTATGTLVAASRVAMLSVAGTLSAAGTISQRVQKITAGALNVSGQIIHRLGRSLSGLLTLVGTVTFPVTHVLASAGRTILVRALDRTMSLVALIRQIRPRE
jgi:hypothetical protein